MPILKISSQLSIHYLDNNPSAKRTVLLFHGLGVNGSSWQLQIPPLLECNYRAISPDFRAFGDSTYPGGKTTVPAMSEDMVALLNYLQVYTVDLIGISMGGAIALQLALDHPELVRKLILVNTFAFLRPDSLSGWVYFATRFGLVQLLGLHAQAKLVSKRLFSKPEQEIFRKVMISQVMQADPQGYRAAMRALWNFDVRDRLATINIPTLVITGDSDTTVPFRLQHQLVEKIPNSRQVMIPDAGHAVTIEKPDEFNQAMMQFLG